MFRFTRRQFVKGTLAGIGAAAATSTLRGISLAANPTGQALHGLSAFGELKYSPDFTGFDFSSEDMPVGGTFAFQPSNWSFNQSTETFNTLNSFVLKGDAPPRMEYCFDTLMAEALDEPDAIYGQLASTVTISPDRNTYTFALRPQARFHDGTPVTAEDIAWSLMLLKEKGHPQLALDLIYLTDAVVGTESNGAPTVVLNFNGKQSDRAILAIASSAPVFSKAWFASRNFEEATLDPILGSGPYRFKRMSRGVFVEYERVADYWGRDLPVMRGLDKFETLRIDFFQERQAAFEAFKKGDVQWREEFTSKVWATEYNFPAVTDGRVKLREFPGEKRPSMQAFAVNARRKKFADPSTRRALATLFDFEWTNKNLFYGVYARSNSLFEKSDFVATGEPDARELALLEPIRDGLDPLVFGTAPIQFATDATGRDRAMFREADRLFKLAGWRKDGSKLVDATGEQLTVEFLIESQAFVRILTPFVDNLKVLGVSAEIRQVDSAQYQRRSESFDFDVTIRAYSLPANPSGEMLKRYFHSSSAAVAGSDNLPGIAEPAIDALVEKGGQATTRAELVVAMRALDRVLRARLYWIPNWHSANHRVAYWDRFGWKEPKPDYAFPVERLWWRDPAKA